MKALYRKYRPVTLDSVVGQDAIVASLKTALKTGKISHAYLFIGPRGCGKTSVARIFAHEINNFKYELEDSYVDIIEIDAASNTGVDNIRELREKAVIAPTTGKYKVYIIDEVHMLSKSAFNALLKLLEEPPEHVVFIMATTDPEKVPITITSRAQTYAFRLAPPDVMQKHLETVAKQESLNITPDAISIIVRRGGGSFRDSISLLDQISTLKDGEITADVVTSALGLPRDEIIKNLLSAYTSGDQSTLTNLLKDLLDSGTKPETLVDELLKTIIAAPSPSLLPLLASLPSVQPPFPEAKLLVAFLKPDGDLRKTGVATSPSRAAFLPAKEKMYIPDGPEEFASKEANSSASQRMTFSPESGAAMDGEVATIPSRETGLPEKSASRAVTTFDWPTFLTEMEDENRTISRYLSTAKPNLTGHTLHIYPEKKIATRILNSPNNKALLVAHAPGLEIEIHTPDELPKSLETKENNPELRQISDIMGNIQELSSSGSPF